MCDEAGRSVCCGLRAALHNTGCNRNPRRQSPAAIRHPTLSHTYSDRHVWKSTVHSTYHTDGPGGQCRKAIPAWPPHHSHAPGRCYQYFKATIQVWPVIELPNLLGLRRFVVAGGPSSAPVLDCCLPPSFPLRWAFSDCSARHYTTHGCWPLAARVCVITAPAPEWSGRLRTCRSLTGWLAGCGS